MQFVLWNLDDDLLHFEKIYASISEAANDLNEHICENPYEYCGGMTFAVIELCELQNKATFDTQQIKELARAIIITKRNAWLHIETDNGEETSPLILPVKKIKSHVAKIKGRFCVWDFSKQEAIDLDGFFGSLKQVANLFGLRVSSANFSEADIFGVFSEDELKKLHAESSSEPISAKSAKLTITIEIHAWLSLRDDNFREKIMLPVSEKQIAKKFIKNL